ncbi:hypothetical protein B0H17DRAFT_1145688 [Mycena rosella]|uniref:Uncharacterized protein n=1 Tax=Mycena rosella TaxID=1033263 RepID=A0AAD7CSP1_MYCRO|nr:hypothetical protein B0H17DRAFT_1145688 [Mycena rosella]
MVLLGMVHLPSLAYQYVVVRILTGYEHWDPAQLQHITPQPAPSYFLRPLPSQPIMPTSGPFLAQPFQHAQPTGYAYHAQPTSHAQHTQPTATVHCVHPAYLQHAYLQHNHLPLQQPPLPPPHFATPTYAPPHARPSHPAPPLRTHPQTMPNPPSNKFSLVSGYVTSIGPVPKVFPLSALGWQDSEKLALECENWVTFSGKVQNALGMQPGVLRFIECPPEDPNPCPSFHMYPAHHRAWVDTDTVVRLYLNEVCMVTERTHIRRCATAAEMWVRLRVCHKSHGPMGQIQVLRRFASIQYASDPST